MSAPSGFSSRILGERSYHATLRDLPEPGIQPQPPGNVGIFFTIWTIKQRYSINNCSEKLEPWWNQMVKSAKRRETWSLILDSPHRGRGKRQSTPMFLPGETPTERRSLVGSWFWLSKFSTPTPHLHLISWTLKLQNLQHWVPNI